MEIPNTNASETLGSSFYYKTFEDLTTIESDTSLMDSGSERCAVDSDTYLGVVSDFELEEQSKGSGSVIWGVDSDSEKSPRDADSRKQPLKAESYQMGSVSVEDVTKTEELLMVIEQVESESLKEWGLSRSEKSLKDSDYEKDSASNNERKKEEKCQMASDSIKRLMESEETMMETEIFCMTPDSESYAVDSCTEKDRASTSKVHMIQVEKKRSKRYLMDSDSESSEMDSNLEICVLASSAMKHFMDTETFHMSTANSKPTKDSWSERTVNSDSEIPVISSESVKHIKKAEACKFTSNLKRLKVTHKSESLQQWLDPKIEQLDSGHSGHWDSSGKYHFRSIVPQDSFGKFQGDLQTFQSITEKDQVDSSSEKYQKKVGNERDQNEPESKRHSIKTEKGFDNEGFQMDKERGEHLMKSDHHDSENEAHRLGARRKDNRPPGRLKYLWPLKNTL